MAEALFMHAAKEYQNNKENNDENNKKNNRYEVAEVSSAGISAFSGEPASYNARKVLFDQWGIDLSSHKSRRLTPEMVQEAGLVLTMTTSHRDELIRRFGSCRDKIFTLKEYINKHFENDYKYDLNILDPYGEDEEVYKECSIEIKEAVKKLLKILFD